jgi:hypothetical protein
LPLTPQAFYHFPAVSILPGAKGVFSSVAVLAVQQIGQSSADGLCSGNPLRFAQLGEGIELVLREIDDRSHDNVIIYQTDGVAKTASARRSQSPL